MIDSARFSRLIQPLFERVLATEARAFEDWAAASVLDRLRIKPTARHGELPIAVRLAPARWIDKKVNRFLKDHPTAQGIEVNGGFSTRFHRLSAQADWPRFSWQLINSRDVNDCLNIMFPATDNFRCIAIDSALQDWTKSLNWANPRFAIVIIGEVEPRPCSGIQTLIETCYNACMDQKLAKVQLLVHHSCRSLKPILEPLTAQAVILDEHHFSNSTGFIQRLMRNALLCRWTSHNTITHIELNLQHDQPNT